MPRRYTTKLFYGKKNATLSTDRSRRLENSDSKIFGSDTDGNDTDEKKANVASSFKDGHERGLRGLLENTPHFTHPFYNQGLAQKAEPPTCIFPSCALTIPLPLYVSGQTTPIVEPCMHRPAAYDEWVTRVNSFKSRYLRLTKQQKQREIKHKHNIYNRYLFVEAEHIAKQENMYFRDSYDYYYTGGNLNFMQYAVPGEDALTTLAMHVSGPTLNELHFSQANGEPDVWLPWHSERLTNTSSEIFELLPINSFRVNHGNMFLARMLNDITIYELKEDEDADEYGSEQQPQIKYKLDCQVKYNSEEGHFISAAQSLSKPETLAIACQDRSVRFVDLITQQDIFKQNVSILRGVHKSSTWAQLKPSQDHIFQYVCQSVLLSIDMRCATDAINPCFASSVYSSQCESFSCLKRGANPNLLYVASNHKLHCLDMRCLGKKLTDRSVVTWTHQMSYPPTVMDTLVFEGSEYIALGGALPSDLRICELSGALAQDFTKMCSPTLPYAPPQLAEAFTHARLHGCEISIYADLGERIKSCMTGLKFQRLEGASDGAFAQLLTASSVGDICCQRLTQREEDEMHAEDRTGGHTNEVIKYYADMVERYVQRPLHCTSVSSLPILREIMLNNDELPEYKPLIDEDVDIDYGFGSKDQESSDSDTDASEEKPNLNPIRPKLKSVGRGKWQKSAFALSRYTDVISTRLLNIWDMHEYEQTRDVNIEMIDENLKSEKIEPKDRTAYWLQQMPDDPMAANADDGNGALVAGTNLPKLFEAKSAEYIEINSNTVKIDHLNQTIVKEEMEPVDALQPGEFTRIETSFEMNPRPAKRAKIKHTMGF